MSKFFAPDVMTSAAFARVRAVVGVKAARGLGMTTTTITSTSSPRVGMD